MSGTVVARKSYMTDLELIPVVWENDDFICMMYPYEIKKTRLWSKSLQIRTIHPCRTGR